MIETTCDNPAAATLVVHSTNGVDGPAVDGSGDDETRRRGGQPGNANAWRHGLFAAGGDDKSVSRGCNTFRRALETAVRRLYGDVEAEHASYIHTAMEATRTAIENRYRRNAAQEAGELTHVLFLAFNQDYRAALKLRDERVAKLGITPVRQADDALTPTIWTAPPAEQDSPDGSTQ